MSVQLQGGTASGRSNRRRSPVGLATVLALVAGPSPMHGQAPALQLISELGCAACHVGLGANADLIRQRAPSLTGAATRFDGAYIYAYLRNPPVRSGIGASRMPDFRLDDQESLALAAFLSNGQSRAGGEASRDYDQARDAYPGITAAEGRAVFVALRCEACHEGVGRQPGQDAPDLRLANRMREDWLGKFLESPEAVRPFGSVPGTGSRMPDFRLTATEAGMIAGLLRSSGTKASRAFAPVELSPFQRDKAERLIRDKWPCLGCHRLDNRGGRIGPDLSGVGARLTGSAIRAMIADPHASVPGTVMPKRIIPDDRIDLAASYLAARTMQVESAYLSLVEHAPREVSTATDSGALYDGLCANCHGTAGAANGYNARYLPVPPTRHSDSAYVARRPDDTLFDGIHVGGFVLNKSHLMPGFGQDLTTEQIRSLVARIRALCRCEGPAWSRDGRR